MSGRTDDFKNFGMREWGDLIFPKMWRTAPPMWLTRIVINATLIYSPGNWPRERRTRVPPPGLIFSILFPVLPIASRLPACLLRLSFPIYSLCTCSHHQVGMLIELHGVSGPAQSSGGLEAYGLRFTVYPCVSLPSEAGENI